MIHVLRRNWWAIAIRGALALIFGILVFLYPRDAVIVLVLLFGAYAAVDGVFAILSAVLAEQAHERWWPFVVEGIVGLTIGALTFYHPGMTALALYVLIALWAMATGLVEIFAAVRVRASIANELMLLIGGIASVLFGLLMLVFPSVGALAVIWLIGFYAILFGALMIAFALRVRAHG
jgi:uncharacterized membrane protein HdeD (DUF308 family)